MNGPLIFAIAVVIVCLIVVAKTAIVVPQQSAYVVERLGRYNNTLHAGFHILVPFVDVIRYRHSLKETALDIPAQVCITRDNVQVQVDGVLYLKILDPERASYGISDYHFAISQLAQTTLRSEVGKIDLDRTFEERTNINTQVVNELDKATESWGVKVLRYEIKNITPPADVLAAMEKQMRAEREKRAVILTSEGQRDAAINNADGEKQQVIKASEARKTAADQRGRGPGGGDPVGGLGDRRGHPPRRRDDPPRRRLRSRAAPRRRAVRPPVRPAGAEVDDPGRAGQRVRRRRDDRDGDAGAEQAAGGLRPVAAAADSPLTPHRAVRFAAGVDTLPRTGIPPTRRPRPDRGPSSLSRRRPAAARAFPARSTSASR